MAELQIAFDGDMSTALDILAQVRPYIDIAEVGTPLVFRDGMSAVRKLRAAYPRLTLVADLKIMDAGEAEADIAFAAGADRVTVMALASDATISGALRSANRHRKQVMVDMMQVVDPLLRAGELLGLGCDLICLHTAHDLQSDQVPPYSQLAQLRAALPEAQLAIAGGLKLPALEQILPLAPQVIIVGSAITAAKDPRQAARQFHERIHRDGIP